MTDVFGYVAYGDNETYHLGALLSALKLLHFCPTAKIVIATDRPELFEEYPVEVMPISLHQKEQWSFGGHYHFGIKAGYLIEILKVSDRLILLDTDHYPVRNPASGFDQISPTRSFMRKNEGPHSTYQSTLPGKDVRIGNYILTGSEPMWQSGIIGVHKANIGALRDAFDAMLSVRELTKTNAPEQFCIGVALSLDGRQLSAHHLPVRHYNRRLQKVVAEKRMREFLDRYSGAPIGEQIQRAGEYRLWRSPIDLLRQRVFTPKPSPRASSFR